MREYEVVYIFKSTLTREEIEARLEAYHQKVLTGAGSEITAVEHWGKRQLAYPIDRHETGYYVVAQFTAAPDVLPQFERALKLDEELLRHLIVLSEGELPVPPSVEETLQTVRAGDGSEPEPGVEEEVEEDVAAPAEEAAVEEEEE
jgi:small subunit ribosomal protein S6